VSDQELYICPVCFAVSEHADDSHEHGKLIRCKVGKPGEEIRKPVKDAHGRYFNRAPRWFNVAAGWIKNNSVDK
jgi:hypothetical protein